MPKNAPPGKEARKIPKNFRLFAEDVRRLKLGAEKMGIPGAIYLQFALREKFEKDGIDLKDLIRLHKAFVCPVWQVEMEAVGHEFKDPPRSGPSVRAVRPRPSSRRLWGRSRYRLGPV